MRFVTFIFNVVVHYLLPLLNGFIAVVVFAIVHRHYFMQNGGPRNFEGWTLGVLILSAASAMVINPGWCAKHPEQCGDRPELLVRTVARIFLMDLSVPFSGLALGQFVRLFMGTTPGFVVTFATGIGVHYFLASLFAVPQQVWSHVRGSKLWTEDEAKETASRARRPNDQGIRIGPLVIPMSWSFQNIFILGQIGSGKTTLLRQLIRSMLADHIAGKKSSVRMVLFDYKHDMMSWLARVLANRLDECRVVVMNPFDERSAAWDMAKDIRTPAHVLALANILFPIDPKATQKFWDQAVHAVFIRVTLTFIERAPDTWTFRDVVNTLLDRERLVETLGLTPKGKRLLANYQNEKMFNDILSTLDSRTTGAGYDIIASIWDRSTRTLSLLDFVNGTPSILVLGKSSVATEAVERLNQVLFERLTQILLDRPEARPEDPWRLFMVFDEAANMGQLPLLTEALTSLRAKNVSVTIAFQDINHWYKVHGDEGAKAMLAQCANVAVLRCKQETADWASKAIGQGEGWMKNFTTAADGRTTSGDHMTTRPVVMPEEITHLPMANPANGVSGYFITTDTHFCFACVRDAFESQIPIETARKEDFVPRPDEHQYLRDFDDEDVLRLGLPTRSPTLDVDTASQVAGQQKPKRFRMKRPSTDIEQTMS
jgi:Type IV secretion-system coupling protein DNA-binding domain